MKFEDKKLQKLVDAAKINTLKVDAVEVDDQNYEALEEAERTSHSALVEYCLTLMPKAIANDVKNSRLFASKIIDKYVFAQI